MPPLPAAAVGWRWRARLNKFNNLFTKQVGQRLISKGRSTMSLEVENFCDIRRPYITFILYEGDQYFWKNKTSIHLTIAEHTSEYLPGIVEIIAYDPILREEAPRLYVSLSEMEDCIDQSKIDVRLQIAVDKASTGSETIDERLLRQQVIRDLKVDYLLTRISINSKNHNNVDKLRNLIEDRRSDNEWTISLIAHFHDQKDDLGQLTLLCSLPRLLTPLRVHRDRYFDHIASPFLAF